MTSSYTKISKHGQMGMFWTPIFFQFNIFQDLFNKILSQQLTHNRSYISVKQYFICCLLMFSMIWVNQSAKCCHLVSVNLFQNKPWILCVCSTSLLKTLKEKEKLLVTSNFYFSQCFQPVWRTFYHIH